MARPPLTNRSRILVTDGDNRAALAVTRSLGRRGHHVVVGEKHQPALAQTSRFCALPIVYPDPAREEARFLEWMAEAVKSHHIDVLLPVADITTSLITAQRSRFEPSCRVPFAEAGVIQRAADKVDVVRTAMRLGLAVPHTVFLASPADLTRELCNITFPVVIKPRRSRVRSAAGWIACSVRYATEEQGLRNDISRRVPEEFPLLLQERIIGPGIGIFLCYDRGRVMARFSHRRLREKPPTGGVSVLSESIEVSPVAGRAAETLLEDLRWQGIAMVEFKVDQRDGVPKLMEINGRFWGSLQLAIDAGVDFPRILVDSLSGRESGPPPAYRIGVKSRWLWGDLDSLMLRLRAGDGLAGSNGRLHAIAEFLKLWEKNLYYENPRLTDLRPWLYETRHWLQSSS